MHTTKSTKTTTRIEMNPLDLVNALQAAGLNIPTTASIYVRVPGGGDWSNTDLAIDEAPLVIEYTEQT